MILERRFFGIFETPGSVERLRDVEDKWYVLVPILIEWIDRMRKQALKNRRNGIVSFHLKNSSPMKNAAQHSHDAGHLEDFFTTEGRI